MTTITPIRKVPDRPAEPDERDVRVDLAACYRLIARFGMDDLVYSHITARVPGVRDQYLLNPYGPLYSEITALNFVKVDDEGNPVEPTDHPVNTRNRACRPRSGNDPPSSACSTASVRASGTEGRDRSGAAHARRMHGRMSTSCAANRGSLIARPAIPRLLRTRMRTSRNRKAMLYLTNLP